MLGHRGCRLGNTYPEITQMQTRAILGAALELKKEGVETHPEIMVPLTGILYEFKQQEEVIRAEAAKLFAEAGDSIEFKVGTMIEIPRAALTADRIVIYTPNSYIVEFDFDGKKEQAVLREAQFHPIREQILHLDFYRIAEGKPVSIAIPVRLTVRRRCEGRR